jgi:hypothetical protein
MWEMLKYLILLMYKNIMWHMFEISISAYSENYTRKKMINNFHWFIKTKNMISFRFIQSFSNQNKEFEKIFSQVNIK